MDEEKIKEMLWSVYDKKTKIKITVKGYPHEFHTIERVNCFGGGVQIVPSTLVADNLPQLPKTMFFRDEFGELARMIWLSRDKIKIIEIKEEN